METCNIMKYGYVQVYTGNGKGKTTAALGLILRASGAGLKIFLCQFMKSGSFSEIHTLKSRFPEVRVLQFGTGRFVKGMPSSKDVRKAKAGLERLRKALTSGRYDMIIADEACTAAACKLLSEDDLIDLVRNKPVHVELVFTGRGAPRRLLAAADLVTEMRDVKHYYKTGVVARKGIEK